MREENGRKSKESRFTGSEGSSLKV